MMKSEFVEILHDMSPTHREPTEAEYEAIEFVYTYHPSIGCKEDIVDLWRNYGNMIIADMTPRARHISKAEENVRQAKIAYDAALEVYNSLLENRSV